jgi:hypothetical protein
MPLAIAGRRRHSPWTTRTERSAVALISGLVLIGGLTQESARAESVHGRAARVGATPAIGQDVPRLGAVAGSAALRFDVELKPRDPAELARLATDIATPGNPLYRRYLPRGRLAADFGPTPAAIASVTGGLQAAGLSVRGISADHLTLFVSGTGARVSAAFSIGLERYRLPGGRVAFANTRPPLFATGTAASVQAVVGLSNVVLPTALGLANPRDGSAPEPESPIMTGGPQPCATASSVARATGGYTADEVASAYSLSGLYGVGDEGSGITVSLFELGPNRTSDIAAYQTCYGTSTSVSYTEVDGGAGTGTGSGEAALDIEQVIGLAPKATIRVYQGPDTQVGSLDTYQRIVDDDTAQVISTSWGYCETQAASVQAENTLFEMAAVQGQSILAASGDLGSEGCGPGDLAVDDPGSQPYVTGVGGTELTTLDPPPLQSVWNANGAGGGGVSAVWKMPAYQAEAERSLGVVDGYSAGSPCRAQSGSYCREVPDVSADADPSTGYLVYYDGGWRALAGTSGAAPLWAAVFALVDASPACAGAPPLGFANPALYRAAATSYESDFDDITAGDNDFTGTNDGLYPALPGYDMASGLGTPIGDSLAETLCESGAVAGQTITVTSPGTQTTRVGSPVDLQMVASDSSGATLAFSATGLPDGLSIGSSGDIVGEPTALGTFSVAVTATDPSVVQGSVEFVWNVVAEDADIVTVTSPGPLTTERGASVDEQISATDSGDAALTFSETGLPGSLQLDPVTGQVLGTVTGHAGEYQVEVVASDPTGMSGSAYFTWTVTAPDSVVVANPGSQFNTVGSSVNTQIGASDSAGLDLYFSAVGLPRGLSISPGGTVTGIPSAAGASSVTVTATDANLVSDVATFTWEIYSIAITPPSLASGTAKTAYRERLSARGGNSPYIWRIAAGRLPGGLLLSASAGLISGRPSEAGTWRFTVAATERAHRSLVATKAYTIAVDLAITPSSLPAARAKAVYSARLAAIGGRSPYAWRIVSGRLPAGLSLVRSTGVISGRPLRAGMSRVAVEVTEPSHPALAATRAYRLVVRA